MRPVVFNEDDYPFKHGFINTRQYEKIVPVSNLLTLPLVDSDTSLLSFSQELRCNSELNMSGDNSSNLSSSNCDEGSQQNNSPNAISTDMNSDKLVPIVSDDQIEVVINLPEDNANSNYTVSPQSFQGHCLTTRRVEF